MFVLFVSLNHLLPVERKFNCRTLGNGRLRENLKLYVRIWGCKGMYVINNFDYVKSCYVRFHFSSMIFIYISKDKKYEGDKRGC